jgi:ketosteroid isomerase-like protein
MSKNTDAIESAYKSFVSDDVQAIIAMIDEGAEWVVPDSLPQGGSFRGPDDVSRFFQRVAETWETLHLDIDKLLDAGDHVVGIGRASGKLHEGREAGYRFVHVFEMNDGRIAGYQEYVDPDETLRSL